MGNKVENIRNVINYIENNLTEKMTLTSIATGVGYSKYHLHRMFVETVGLSIHDYVQRRQLTEAAKLLVFSKQSILDISLIAVKADIPACLELTNLVIDGFPNLNEKEYLAELERGISEQRVLILTDDTMAVALMFVNFQTGSIDFFGVHPLYRKCGITKIFLDKIMKEFLKDKDITITTFREGDKADTGYRKAYKELGFAEAELLVEFGYPTQKLVLSSKKRGNTNE